ncbi:MAG: DinB family protein [Pseudomonadota bacterium]
MTNKISDLPDDSASSQTQIGQQRPENLTRQSLIDTNIKGLNEGLELVQLLNGEQFQQRYKPAFESTVGAHFRHLLEHYRCFLEQLEGGVICYDDRERDDRLERDREYALACISDILQQLQLLDMDLFDRPYTIKDCQAMTEVATSLERELLFLQSHTVHHYALIAAMTRGLGVRPNADFGVAIATQKHRDDCQPGNSDQFPNDIAHAAEKKTCAQ